MITGSSSCRLCRLHIWPTAQRIFMEHMRRYCENQFARMYRNSVPAIWCAFRKQPRRFALFCLFQSVRPRKLVTIVHQVARSKRFWSFGLDATRGKKTVSDLQVPRKNSTPVTQFFEALQRAAAEAEPELLKVRFAQKISVDFDAGGWFWCK